MNKINLKKKIVQSQRDGNHVQETLIRLLARQVEAYKYYMLRDTYPVLIYH